MCVSRSKFLAVFFLCFVPFLGWVLAPQAHGSIIVPATLTEVNRQGDSDPVTWDDSRDIGDPYWNDRGEAIDSQGNITDAMTGKSMLGLEGLLLSNDAKDTEGNAAGENYELNFQIDPGLAGKARVYVMIGIRDAFSAAPVGWLEGRLNDDSYSPQMNVDRNHPDRTWIGLDAYGAPIGPVFNRVLRRPAPDGRPMAFPCRDGVGEEYFAFYHDFEPGESVGIYGCYSNGSNYFVFVEMAPPVVPDIWTSADIGATRTGDTQYEAGPPATYHIYGNGGDIWGDADAFRYVFMEHSGDFFIQAHVESQVHAHDWAKAGLMVRQSTDAGSQHVNIVARGLNDWFGMQFRDTAGQGSGGAHDNWDVTALPRWFKLERTGDTFTSYWSYDATNWTTIGSHDLALTDPVLVGMAMTSHHNNRISAASFSRPFVTGKGMVFAHAGMPQTVSESSTVTLDGSASQGVITSWLWEQVAGPDVAPIFNVTTANPWFETGDYIGDQVVRFKLTLNGEDASFVDVMVEDGQKALADAGADQEGYEMRPFQLDATGSTTRDGALSTDMSYQWTQVGGPAVYKLTGTDTATPTFIAPEITPTIYPQRPQWPPWRTLTFEVVATAPNGSQHSDTVNVTINDHEFETVFYREHEDFDFHGSLEDGRWYPEEAEWGVHYAAGKIGIEQQWAPGMLDPNVDYSWPREGGDTSYRPDAHLGNDPDVARSCGTDWKLGWFTSWPADGSDFLKYTFDLPHGSSNAYIVNWMGTDDGWHGNVRAYYDYEEGNTSPVGYFRVCIRGWERMAPLNSPPFAVSPGLHRIMMETYGAGEPNLSRFELHVPMPDVNIANAGPDQGAVSGETVTLDGRGSQAVDTTYTWDQISPDSPAVTLNDLGNGVATFTAPATAGQDFIFRLTVSGASNSSVDFVHVTVIPPNAVIALFADQRTARDMNNVTDWGDRDHGGAEWGSDYVAGYWGAPPMGARLGSDYVVHHYNNDVDDQGGQFNGCYSEITFNLPAGFPVGDPDGYYYAFVRAAHRGDGSGNSAFMRVNEGLAGIWPAETPGNQNYRFCEDSPNGWFGSMCWHWSDINGNTIATPLQAGQNQIRIYGRESRCQEGRPFTWDAIILSTVDLDENDWEMMDAIARAAQIPVGLVADAGPDFTLYEGETGILDGTGSMGATSYAWAQVGGPDPTINDADQPIANFVAPTDVGPTTLTFELTVGDGTNTASDTADVLVLKAAAPPAPMNLTAESVELGIRLDWDAAPGAISYTMLRRDLGDPWPYDVTVADNVVATHFVDRSMDTYMDTVYSYTVFAVNAFGQSAAAIPAQAYALSANHALRGDTGPFAKKPHPGWTLGDLMNNRHTEETFDSWFNNEPSADDWWGYRWPTPLYFQEIHYYPGNVFWDGGYWTSLGVQFTKDGVFWYDIPNVSIEPPYDFTDSPDGRSPAFGQLPYIRRHVLRFPRVEGIGVRIYGAPGGVADFTSMAELEIYGVPGPEGYLYSYAGPDFSVDDNTTATLDGSDSSTPLAVQYHWEQVTGAGGQVLQVDMTSAFNSDVIYALGEDLAAQDPYEPGGSNWLYSSNPDIAPAGSNPLPADGKVGDYQLGPYTANNCLLLSDQQRNGVVAVPPGNYGSLGVAFSGASGNHWTQLYLNYADGDSPVIWFEFSDWFFRGDVERAWQNSFRVSRNDESTGWADGDPGGPNIYHRVLPVDYSRTLLSVTFAGFPGGGAQTGGVFAMNLGPPVPLLNLVNPDSAVCTFDVPDITGDQVVTFRLTVWDAMNNSATDDVDVLLMDTSRSEADAGADALGAPFTNFVLDGSGTAGDAIWYRWEQIGGPAAVALWNGDQAQATIILPDAGARMLFKLTAGAANGTVSSDTVVVTSAYGLPVLPSVPSSGYIQDVLMCGANYASRFTSNHTPDHDHLAANGGQANQYPSAGDPIDIGGESFADGPAVWTPMHRDDGVWLGTAEGDFSDFVAYFHVFIISPQQRDARAIIRHDDEMRCWNNGALSFQRDGWDDGVEQSLDFTLYEGVNSMTYKISEGGGGNNLSVRFTDRNNVQYADLQYAVSAHELLPPVQAFTYPDPPEALVVESGEVFYLDGRASTAGVNYSWEQVWPTDPAFVQWFDDENVVLLGAPWVDEDTDFYIRLWADDGTNNGADVVKVTVATKELPGAVTNATGEWAGDVGAVLRWSPAEHASRYIIERDGVEVGTAFTNAYVDTGPLALDGTYSYTIVPASILNVGPASDPIAITRDPNLGNMALSDMAMPVVGQPSPTGGGSRDIGLMKDGIVSGQNYDTFDGNTPNPGSQQGEETFEFFGYLFDSAVEVHSLVYYTGGAFVDGGFWTTLGVQVTRDGVTWQDASGFVSGPLYDTTDSPDGRSWNEKYIISILPDTVTGVRIAGHAGGSMRFVSIAELEVYGDIGGLNVNAGADASVNELDVVTLDGSATTGATSVLWTQVAGPPAVIMNADQLVASFTAPGTLFTDSVTFRLTASNAQWSSWDEVTFAVFDVDTWHIYRYTADFDGRSATGRLMFADGTWVQGYTLHDQAQYMRDLPANEAATEDAVAGNDYFFQNADRSQTYRPDLDPFDVRFLSAGEVDPFIGYTTAGDWWNYTYSSTKTEDTRFPADGVMAISVLTSSGTNGMSADVLVDEVVVTTVSFTSGNWGDFQWRPGADTFLVTQGAHTVRLHLTSGGWDFCKFRLDLAVPAIELVARTDDQVILKWNDVGREYIIQGSYDLTTWVDVYGPTPETWIITDIPPERFGFYRIEVQ